VCDEHTEGQLAIGIDWSMRLSGPAFRCGCDVCQHDLAVTSQQIVDLAAELDAVELVLVTFVAPDRIVATAGDVARLEGLRVECRALGIELLDHLLMSGHRWCSVREAGGLTDLSEPGEGPGASTRW